MNFDRSLLFSWLEEDNIQRAYFRVRPLLTTEGDIRAEAEQLWPNEGCLRIVPDRNEQHTFKVRMRTLGSYCVVDLTNQPVDAGKIRTNKNFRPDRGEVNQYILYSDTVHELPEHTFYQIIDGAAEDYAAACEKSITPLFYIRQGDTLYGPVRKTSPQKPDTAGEAAGTLFELPCPDGVTRLMLCMNDAPVAMAAIPMASESASPVPAASAEIPAENSADAAAPIAQPEEAKTEDAPLPIAEPLKILDQSKDFEETLQSLDKPVSKGANLLRQQEAKPAMHPIPAVMDKPGVLSGTPLVRTPLRTSVQQPKNRVQEVISNQWSIGKYEPPAQNLPAGMAMRKVENPVETACNSLRAAWHSSDAQGQLIDCILSLDGVRARLEPKLCQNDGVTILQKVLRDRLQDLEAERLTALCELDKARRDVDAYKAELLSGMAGRIQRETGRLEADKAACEKHVNELKAEVNALTLQRDALLAKVAELQSDVIPSVIAKLAADAHMIAPMNGIPLRLSPEAGQSVAPDVLIGKLIAACAASGITLERNQAIAALVLLAVSPRIGIACTTPAPLSTLMKNLTAAFGWSNSYAHQIAPEQKPVTSLRPVDGTPALLMTSLPHYAILQDVSKLLLSRNATSLTRNVAYDMCQWPILLLPALPFVPELAPAADAEPVSAASVTALLDTAAASDAEIDAVLAPVLNAAAPLSGAARSEMFRFIAVCAGLMDGGLPVAVDWAILLWIVPAIERGGRTHAAVKALLDEYPLSLEKL
ncbi:MAG: hypothetical protein IJZ74_11715 [Clostridia bacterium]|nr:hypothetical protein [Clostridia bacterium]